MITTIVTATPTAPEASPTTTRAKVEAGTIRFFAGRAKVGEWKPDTIANDATLEGILAAMAWPTTIDDAKRLIEDALEEAAARRGSVIPDHYRHQYGADQNCGDGLAAALLAAAGGGCKDDLDMAALEAVAGENAVGDRFDGWMTKGLNNGMVRMNLANVLRGKVRRGEPVLVKGQPITAL
jgi:hypothetical protein